MIELGEIAKAIGRAIGDKYKVYVDPPKQLPDGEDIYVIATVTPLSSPQRGQFFVERTVMADLTLLGDTDVTQTEYLQFIWDCDKAFRPVVKFAERVMMPSDITSTIADGIGHYVFDLTFYDTLEGAFETTTPDMGDIDIRRT